jgi:hypothetical protein
MLITARQGPHGKHISFVAVSLLHSCLLGFLLLLKLIFAVETCLIVMPLLSDGCCIFAYSAGVT